MVPSLKVQAAKSLGHAITVSGISIICQFNENQEEGLQKLEKVMEKYETNLSLVPTCLHEELCFEILKILEQRFYLYKSSEFACVVLKRLMKLITRLKLYRLSSSDVPYTLRQQLYLHLENLTELRLLEIKSVIMISIKTIYSVENLLIRAVRNLKHLHKLTLYSYCTNGIIETVAKSCPELWYLNAKFSQLVTNKSVPFLIKCPNLKEVVLTHTCISMSGYADLLLGKPNLTRLITDEHMNDVIDLVNVLKRPDLQLDITSLIITNVQVEHMKFIAKHCHRLSSLSVSCEFVDFTILSGLTHLQELAISKADFEAHGIDDLLETVGNNILVLKLYRVENVSFYKLNSLCPKLQRLQVDACSFSKNCVPVKRTTSMFSHLEHITCGEKVPKCYLELLLTKCKRVKFLYLEDISNCFTDQSMQKVLRQNSMSSLEELCIFKSKNLSMSTVNVIVNKCTKLKIFYGLERFSSISSTELKQFVHNHEGVKFFTLEAPMFLLERYKLPW